MSSIASMNKQLANNVLLVFRIISRRGAQIYWDPKKSGAQMRSGTISVTAITCPCKVFCDMDKQFRCSNNKQLHIQYIFHVLTIFFMPLAYFICSLFLCRYFLVKLEVLCLLFMKVFPDSKFCKCQKISKTTIFILFARF